MTTTRKTQGKANPVPWDDDDNPQEELDQEKAPSVPAPTESTQDPAVSDTKPVSYTHLTLPTILRV